MTVTTDDFNRANGGLGANYTNFIGGGMSVDSNRAIGTLNEERSNLRTGESYSADQYVKVTLTAGLGSKFIGVVLRGSGADGTRNCYLVDVGLDAGDWYIGQYTNGSGPNIASGTFGVGVLQIGDVLEGRVEGDTVSIWRNGTMVDSVADSTHATGAPGLYSYSLGEFDDAEFGDLSAGSVAKQAMHYKRLRA